MLARFIQVILALVLIGCNPSAKEDRIYFISGSTGSETDIFVNGNPTNGGNALMLYLVNGRNTIELRGDGSEGGSYLQVFRGKSIFDTESEVIVDKRWHSSAVLENEVVEFEAVIDDKWIWQEAEVLGAISTEDQAAIHRIYDRICDEMKGDGFDPKALLSRGDSVLWSQSPEHVDRMNQLTQEIGAKIPPPSELVFQSAAHDELRLLVGKQLAMLICDQETLVSLRPAEQEKPIEQGEIRWSFYYGFSQMFFAKFDGSWKLVIPNL